MGLLSSFYGLSMGMPITTIAINYWTRTKTISWLLRTELGGTLFIWHFQLVLSSLFSWLRKNSSRVVSLVGGSVCAEPSQLTVKILAKKLSSTLLTCLRRVTVVWLCSQVVAAIHLMLRGGLQLSLRWLRLRLCRLSIKDLVNLRGSWQVNVWIWTMVILLIFQI